MLKVRNLLILIIAFMFVIIPYHSYAKETPGGDMYIPEVSKSTKRISLASGNKIPALTSPKQEANRFYYYNTLNADEKKGYMALYTLTEHPTENCEITVDNFNDPSVAATGNVTDYTSTVYYAFVNDYPERAWIKDRHKNTYSQNYAVYFELNRPFASMTEFNNFRNTAFNRANLAVKGIPTTDSPQVKAAKAYYVVAKMLNYKNDADINHTMFCLSCGNKAVCDGYASLYKYILNKMGIECAIVDGMADNGMSFDYHAWNLVKLSGDWYEVDPCWGDCYDKGWDLKTIPKFDPYYDTPDSDNLNRTTSWFEKYNKHYRIWKGYKRMESFVKRAPVAKGTKYNGKYMNNGLLEAPYYDMVSGTWYIGESGNGGPVAHLYCIISKKNYRFDKANANGGIKRTVAIKTNRKNTEFQSHIYKVVMVSSNGNRSNTSKLTTKAGWVTAKVVMDNGQEIVISDKLLDSKSSKYNYKQKTVKLKKTKFKYNGKSHKVTVIAKDTKNKTIPKSKYKITYENNKKKGVHKVYITFNDGKTYIRKIKIV